MLHIHLFGYLRLLREGQPYRFRGLPKSAALLAYLLLHRDHPVARDHLAYLLWDDVPESEARANLRRHLHDLLRALPAGQEWLLRDTRSVQWHPDAPAWLDVAEFESLCRQPERLTEAIALYTGDLLQDLYDDWLTPERERLRALYQTTLARLMARERDSGDLIQAMFYARQLLSHDPTREDVMRDYLLMRYQSGDRAGAMELYQQFKARLAEELGVAPMPETTAVFEQIATGQVAGRTVSPPSTIQPATPPPHNLPARLTSFVGRQAELAEIVGLLGTPDSPVRLLTLTGPGGTGKTRLAIEAAAALWQQRPEQYPDGLYLVDLAEVAVPDRVAAAVAETLALGDRPELTESENLRAALGDKRMLLLLDNFDHLVEAAPLLVELLAAAPHLRLLVTSQATLHLYGEHEFPLPPLPLPDPSARPGTAELMEYPAVRLFVERLRAGQPHFELTAGNSEAVVAICRCLDGLPLALELAAGRGKLFSPAAMLTQLNQRLNFLTSQQRNVPTRHQTLRAALGWSYQLLNPAEQALFAAVALFAGPFTIEAAQWLFGDSDETGPQLSSAEVAGLLYSLVDKNMLRALPAEVEAEPHFRMLQTMREYGLEQLGQMAAADALRQRYAEYYVELAEQGRAGLQGGDQAAWLRRLRQEEGNLMAALEWLFSDPDSGRSGPLLARIAIATSRFWIVQGRVREARYYVDRALAYLPVLAPAQQVFLLNEAGNVAQTQGDYTAAEGWHEEALALARREGLAFQAANSLHFLAYAAGRQGHHQEAKSRFLECLALYRQIPEVTPLALSTLLNNLAIVHKRLGEYDEAIALLQESVALKRAIGDHLGLPSSLTNLGNILLLHGELEPAAAYYREALELRLALADRPGLLYSIQQMAALAVAQGRFRLAATLYAAGDAQHQALAIPRPIDAEADLRRDLERIGDQLSPAELADCQAAGTRLTLEEAAALALAEMPAINPL
jgi:predicted ATPase/DNA-binding SARP family transcriptional activator/Tfp pilus assembly protein PilF